MEADLKLALRLLLKCFWLMSLAVSEPLIDFGIHHRLKSCVSRVETLHFAWIFFSQAFKWTSSCQRNSLVWAWITTPWTTGADPSTLPTRTTQVVVVTCQKRKWRLQCWKVTTEWWLSWPPGMTNNSGWLFCFWTAKFKMAMNAPLQAEIDSKKVKNY